MLAHSPKAPGLPYITRGNATDEDLTRLRAGLKAAIADPALATIRHALLIDDFEVLPLSAYRVITDMETEACGAEWPTVPNRAL